MAAADESAAALTPAKTLLNTAKTLKDGEQVALARPATGKGKGNGKGKNKSTGGQGLIGFEAADLRTTTRLPEGDFPKYAALIPDETDLTTHATVTTGPLIEAVRRIDLVAARDTPIRLTFPQDTPAMEAGSDDDAQALDGDEITIAFNPGYLLDGLTALDNDLAHFAFTTATRPALLRSTPDPDSAPEGSFRPWPPSCCCATCAPSSPDGRRAWWRPPAPAAPPGQTSRNPWASPTAKPPRTTTCACGPPPARSRPPRPAPSASKPCATTGQPSEPSPPGPKPTPPTHLTPYRHPAPHLPSMADTEFGRRSKVDPHVGEPVPSKGRRSRSTMC